MEQSGAASRCTCSAHAKGRDGRRRWLARSRAATQHAMPKALKTTHRPQGSVKTAAAHRVLDRLAFPQRALNVLHPLNSEQAGRAAKQAVLRRVGKQQPAAASTQFVSETALGPKAACVQHAAHRMLWHKLPPPAFGPPTCLCDSRSLQDRATNFTPRFLNSSCSLAAAPSSLVHTCTVGQEGEGRGGEGEAGCAS